MSARQEAARLQFASQYGRFKSKSDNQVDRLIQQKAEALKDVTPRTTHPLLEDINKN